MGHEVRVARGRHAGPGFSRKARMAAEGDCYRNMKGFETLAMLRNDIDHGGMNDSPESLTG
jgi:hypothetical protein